MDLTSFDAAFHNDLMGAPAYPSSQPQAIRGLFSRVLFECHALRIS
jgi:hypothetical protein